MAQVLMVGFLASVVVGCGASASRQPQPPVQTPDLASRPATPAKLTFGAPLDGSPLPPGVIHVRLQLVGATIVRQTSTRVTPTEGHIHFSINDKLVSMNYSTVQDVPLNKGIYKLTAEFVGADHFPFNPRAVTTIVVPVQ